MNTAKLDVGDTMLINGVVGWLVRTWEHSGGMREDDDGCCCGRCCCRGGGGEAAGTHRRDDYTQYLRRKDGRLQRMTQCLGVGILLFISVAVTVLVTAVHGGRARDTPHCQPTPEPRSHSPGLRVERQQQEKAENPLAMLTAPIGDNTAGAYLKWEPDLGKAICRGGFNYSNGDLVVPRNGFYRVFLQITYGSTTDHSCKPQLSNCVLLFQESYKANVELLRSFDTVNCSMEQWSKSLYTSGVFYMEANSRLRVQSSHREHIAKNEHLVFFGAELLPP